MCEHISQMMENLVAQAELAVAFPAATWRPEWFLFPMKPTLPRAAAVPRRRFMHCATSSETLPIEIVIANTKGFTGHAMAPALKMSSR